jgi:hypothetical protein
MPPGQTLHDMMKKEFSAPVYDNVQRAIFRGSHILRERASHKRLVSEVRWESITPPDPFSEEAPPPPEICLFPPALIQLISAYEM